MVSTGRKKARKLRNGTIGAHVQEIPLGYRNVQHEETNNVALYRAHALA